jgi:hypothetical protein
MINKLFPPNYQDAPHKKFRGKKRYFKKLIRDAQNFLPSLENDDWYDMWHYHADWKGYGNLGWKFRFKHIEALCVIYQKFADSLKNYGKPYQLWIYLDQNDAAQDAVYFHTQNPNRDNYPCKFEDAQWGIPIIEQFFSEIMPLFKFRAGKQEWNDSQIYFIYCLDIGDSIE